MQYALPGQLLRAVRRREPAQCVQLHRVCATGRCASRRWRAAPARGAGVQRPRVSFTDRMELYGVLGVSACCISRRAGSNGRLAFSDSPFGPRVMSLEIEGNDANLTVQSCTNQC